MNADHAHKGADHPGHSHDDAPKTIALNPDADGRMETTLRGGTIFRGLNSHSVTVVFSFGLAALLFLLRGMLT